MGYVQKLLGRSERIVFITRQHWIVLAGSLVANVLLSALIWVLVILLNLLVNRLSPGLTPLAWLPLVLQIIPVARFGRRLLYWWNEQYIITNRRVIQTEGIFDKHVIDSSLEKVNDVVLDQTAFGRALGFGDVEILTASEFGVNRFERINQPVRFKTEMLNQKEDLGVLDEFGRRAERILDASPPSGGDIPELIAELDELRQKGIITEQEFQQKKQELLRKI